MAKKKAAKRMGPKAMSGRTPSPASNKTQRKPRLSDDPVVVPPRVTISDGQPLSLILKESGINNDDLVSVVPDGYESVHVEIPDVFKGGNLPWAMRIGTEEPCVVTWTSRASPQRRRRLFAAGKLTITIRPSNATTPRVIILNNVDLVPRLMDSD